MSSLLHNKTVAFVAVKQSTLPLQAQYLYNIIIEKFYHSPHQWLGLLRLAPVINSVYTLINSFLCHAVLHLYSSDFDDHYSSKKGACKGNSKEHNCYPVCDRITMLCL